MCKIVDCLFGYVHYHTWILRWLLLLAVRILRCMRTRRARAFVPIVAARTRRRSIMTDKSRIVMIVSLIQTFDLFYQKLLA